jgi:FMN phosphatase YigB (HAD superfamily)
VNMSSANSKTEGNPTQAATSESARSIQGGGSSFPISSWIVDEDFVRNAVAQGKALGAVSFDIFDTALTRTVDSPVDVFSIVEDRLQDFYGSAVGGFGEARERAERKARKALYLRRGAEEVTLDDIYDELPETFPSCRPYLDHAKALELEVEQEVLVVVPDVFVLIEELASAGIPYFFVSDMYLPPEFLAETLALRGYRGWSDLYVSSSVGKTKATGRVWAEVANKYDLQRVLHIGDDKHSDVAMPKSIGMAALEFPRAVSARRAGHRLNPPSVPFSKATRIYQLTSRAQPSSTESIDEEWARLGRTFGALVVGSFLVWLRDRALVNGISHLYFCSRDGFVLQRAWNEMGFGKSTGITSSYLKVSRKVLNQAAGFWESSDGALSKAFENFLVGFAHDRSLEATLQGSELIACPGLVHDLKRTFRSLDFVVERPEEIKLLVAALRRHAGEIRQELKPVAASVTAYLSQEGVFASSRKAMVDIGWHGTMQASLARLQSIQGATEPISGFYLGLWPDASGNRFAAGFMESCFGSEFLPHSEQPALSESVPILEQLLSAPHGSIQGYVQSESGEVTAVEQDRPFERHQYERVVRPFQDALVEELARVVAANGSSPIRLEELTPSVGLHAIGSLILSPTSDELQMLVNLQHASSFDHSEFEHIIQRKLPMSQEQAGELLAQSEWPIGQVLYWLERLRGSEVVAMRTFLQGYLDENPGRKPRAITD